MGISINNIKRDDDVTFENKSLMSNIFLFINNKKSSWEIQVNVIYYSWMECKNYFNVLLDVYYKLQFACRWKRCFIWIYNWLTLIVRYNCLIVKNSYLCNKCAKRVFVARDQYLPKIGNSIECDKDTAHVKHFTKAKY